MISWLGVGWTIYIEIGILLVGLVFVPWMHGEGLSLVDREGGWNVWGRMHWMHWGNFGST